MSPCWESGGNAQTDTWLEFLHFDGQAQLIHILVRSTEGIWGDVVRCIFVCVGVFRQSVLVQGSAELTELETSDRAEEHVHNWSVHTHRHTHFQSVFNCKHLSLDLVSHLKGYFLTLCLQVLKYLDYVFTGVFTFEMVIKVRRLLKWKYTLTWAVTNQLIKSLAICKWSWSCLFGIKLIFRRSCYIKSWFQQHVNDVFSHIRFRFSSFSTIFSFILSSRRCFLTCKSTNLSLPALLIRFAVLHPSSVIALCLISKCFR